MTASFQGSLSSKGKYYFLVISSLIAWHLLGVGMAHAETVNHEKPLVFEIKSTTESPQTQNSRNLAQAAEFVKIDEKVSLVRNYLQSKKAPLADYTEILLAQDDWKKIIAISNSESNMGVHCYRQFNCSGIFTSNGLKVYRTMPEWIVDMQGLIDKRYKTMSLDKMDGIYVQPRSTNWLAASSSIYHDLDLIDQKVQRDSALQIAALNTELLQSNSQISEATSTNKNSAPSAQAETAITVQTSVRTEEQI